MKIAVLEPMNIGKKHLQLFQSQLQKLGHEFVFYPSRTEEKPELIERAKNADVILLSNIPFDGEMILKCPNLKMISVAFTGIDHIDINTCKKQGITVCNSAGYSTQAVAELTIGLIFDVLRKITELDANTRALQDRKGFIGQELAGKTVGVIGAGAIGSKVGKNLNCLGCEVYFWSRTIKKDVFWGNQVSLDELLAISDIVSLHIPLTKETDDLINSNSLKLMKNGAILINTARGKVVNSSALTEALKSGKLSGAGVDVFETEPPLLPNHALLDAPNCILTPHIGYATHEALYNRSEIVIDNVISWLNGKPKNVNV